jgi:hypothetical protein
MFGKRRGYVFSYHSQNTMSRTRGPQDIISLVTSRKCGLIRTIWHHSSSQVPHLVHEFYRKSNKIKGRYKEKLPHLLQDIRHHSYGLEKDTINQTKFG